MTSKAVVFLMAFLFFTKSGAQFVFLESDVPSMGLAGIQSLYNNHWSGSLNPASLADIERISFSAGYLNYYRIAELGTGTFHATLPVKNGTFGCGFMTMGYSVFRQYMTTMAYAMRLGKHVNAGVGIHYLAVRQPNGYSDLNAWIPSMGIQVKTFKNLIAGAFIFNPAGQDYRPSGFMQIPRFIATGLGYQLGEEVFLCLEIEKWETEPAAVSGGMELSVYKSILFRFGMKKASMLQYSFGTGITFRNILIDLSVWHHPVLGISPSMAITYAFK